MTFDLLDKNTVNSIGIVFATVGGGLLWYFIGEVTEVNKKGILAGEEVTLTIPDNTPELRRRLRRHLWLSRIGVFLTVTGGGLQGVSIYML
ncbi:MAG: hypothetical protein WBK19_01770 [Azonexus sp.]